MVTECLDTGSSILSVTSSVEKKHTKKKKEQRRKWHGDNLATEERFVIGNGQQIIR